MSTMGAGCDAATIDMNTMKSMRVTACQGAEREAGAANAGTAERGTSLEAVLQGDAANRIDDDLPDLISSSDACTPCSRAVPPAADAGEGRDREAAEDPAPDSQADSTTSESGKDVREEVAVAEPAAKVEDTREGGKQAAEEGQSNGSSLPGPTPWKCGKEGVENGLEMQKEPKAAGGAAADCALSGGKGKDVAAQATGSPSAVQDLDGGRIQRPLSASQGDEERIAAQKRRKARRKSKEKKRSLRLSKGTPSPPGSSTVVRKRKTRKAKKKPDTVAVAGDSARLLDPKRKTTRSASTPVVGNESVLSSSCGSMYKEKLSPKASSDMQLPVTNGRLPAMAKRKGNAVRKKRDTPAPQTFRHFHDLVLDAHTESKPVALTPDVTRKKRPKRTSPSIGVPKLARTQSMEQLADVQRARSPPRAGSRSSRILMPGRDFMHEPSGPGEQASSIYVLPELSSPTTTLMAMRRGHYSKHFSVASDENVLAKPSETDDTILTVTSPKQGVLTDLVEWCCYFPRTETVRSFLLAYRNVATPEQLFEAVTAVWRKHERTVDPLDNSMERVYLFLAQWLLYWAKLDLSPAIRSELLGFVQLRFAVTMERASNHIKLIVLQGNPVDTKPGTMPHADRAAALAKKLEKMTAAKDKKAKSRPGRLMSSFRASPPTVDMWRIAPESLPGVAPDILQFPNSLIAQQLTLLHADTVRKIELREFLGNKWQKANKDKVAPTLTALSNEFNKLSLWVATTIVTAETPKRQSQMYKKFIRLSQALLNIRNYSCCVAVSSGLNNIAVTRLSHIRDGVSEKYLNILHNVEDTFNPAENYKEYRRLERTPPCLPFMPLCRTIPVLHETAVHLRDISYIHETMADYADVGEPVINFEKLAALGAAVYGLGIHDSETCDYLFERDEMLVSVILGMVESNLDEDELYRRSVNAKPVLLPAHTGAADVPVLIEDSKALSPEMFHGKEHLVKKEVKEGLRGKSLFTLMLSDNEPPRKRSPSPQKATL